MTRSKAIVVLLIVIIIGVLLRSYDLTDRSLWFDEAFSWRLIQFPLGEMIERDAADVHPPLYYIILKGWSVVFGTSLLTLRSFSVVMAGLTIAAGYLLAASAWRSRAVGLTAAAFLAVSGWQISFAWEARMYTLGTALALFSTWLLLKAVRQSHLSLLWWAAYGLAAAAFAYVHYFAFFTLSAHALFVAGYLLITTRGRIGEMINMSTTWFALLGALIAVGLYIPWISVFIEQNRQVQESWWPEAINSWSIPHTFYRMFIPMVGSPDSSGWGVITTLLPISLVVLGWLVLGLSCRARPYAADKYNTSCDASWLIILCGVVPFLLSVFMSFMGQSIYQDRFLVFANLFIFVGLAALIWRLRVRYLPTVLAAVFVVMFSWSFMNYRQELNFSEKPGAREATVMVMNNREENEPVFVSSSFIYFAVDYYAKEELGNQVNPRLYSESGRLAHFGGGPILTEEDIAGPDELNAVLPGEAVWVVDTTGFGGAEWDIPGSWRHEQREVFREVFPHQGDVIVNKYIKE